MLESLVTFTETLSELSVFLLTSNFPLVNVTLSEASTLIVELVVVALKVLPLISCNVSLAFNTLPLTAVTVELLITIVSAALLSFAATSAASNVG